MESMGDSEVKDLMKCLFASDDRSIIDVKAHTVMTEIIKLYDQSSLLLRNWSNSTIKWSLRSWKNVIFRLFKYTKFDVKLV